MESAEHEAHDVLTAETAQRAAQAIAPATEIAVDVEADSMHAFQARLCYVQVATDAGIWLFDTLAPGVSASTLAETFGDPQRTKFFHAAGGDLQYLAEAGVRVNGLFDTHRAATLLGWPKVGLADLVLEKHRVVLDKGHQQADFSIRPLPPAVRQYIADDVRYLCQVGRWVREECQKADILEEVQLDCQRLCDEATVRPDLTKLVPKVPKGGLSANLAQLAVAIGQALHLKRLEWAQAANVPMGRMLSNAAIVSIATHPPSNLKELARAQGVRGAFVREHGDELIELVRKLIEQSRSGTLVLTNEEKEPRDPRRRKRDEALREWRSEKAKERKVTPSVVLTNPLIENLSREPPRSLEEFSQVPYFGPKRARLYGAELLQLLSGIG